jgi:uncharacterized protein
MFILNCLPYEHDYPALQPKPTTMTQSISQPLRQKERIRFIDAVRGLALLGILLMNSMAQSQAHFFYMDMDLSQPVTGPNFWAWVVEAFLFEGTMRGLFSILFGAGTILLLNRLEKQKAGLEPADIYYRRLLWLLVFGLINAFIFLWPGDILYPYALCGLLLFPFRNWSVKYLLIAAFVFLAIGTYRMNSGLYDAKNTIAKGHVAEQLVAKKVTLTETQQEDLDKYKGLKEKTSKEGIAKQAKAEEKKVKGQGYLSIFRYYRDINMKLQSKGFYNDLWDILVCFFLGMALFKSGFLLGKKSVLLYSIVAVIGLGAGLLMNYYFLRFMYQVRFDHYEYLSRWKFNYYEIRRVLVTMGYLSTLILLYKIIPFRKIINVFAPVGQMAFTNYLSQSIITSIFFYGFGWYASLQRYEVYYVVVSIWVFQIIFSHLWLRYFRFGPFEWVWRSLTYWKKQPMKRSVTIIDQEEEGTTVPALA